jgi:hypothetical protein
MEITYEIYYNQEKIGELTSAVFPEEIIETTLKAANGGLFIDSMIIEDVFDDNGDIIPGVTQIIALI